MSIKAFWNDEDGATYSIEIVLAGTILGLGMITGMTSARDGIITELADVGGAVAWLNQSYTIGGVKAHCANDAGMSHIDFVDFCDDDNSDNSCNSRCLVVCDKGGAEAPHNG